VVYLTGIGSSETHARYLEALMKKYTPFHCKFLSIMDFYDKDFKPEGKLIIFS
jgi:hypothetical protein